MQYCIKSNDYTMSACSTLFVYQTVSKFVTCLMLSLLLTHLTSIKNMEGNSHKSIYQFNRSQLSNSRTVIYFDLKKCAVIHNMLYLKKKHIIQIYYE